MIERASQITSTQAAYLTALYGAGGFGQAIARKTLTFDGGTVNAVGDFDGTGNPATLFTVTGTVVVRIVAVCITTCEGASSTIEVGTAAATPAIIALTTATNIAAGEIWHDATPDAEIEALSVMRDFIISDGNDISLLVATANATAGVIDFYCIWTPLSANGVVV